MTFLRYVNIGADLLRNVLKEPHKTKAQARSVIHYKYTPFTDGKQGKPSRLSKQGLLISKSFC
jgi:F-type H+-transporting ATPase subunit epsilon